MHAHGTWKVRHISFLEIALSARYLNSLVLVIRLLYVCIMARKCVEIESASGRHGELGELRYVLREGMFVDDHCARSLCFLRFSVLSYGRFRTVVLTSGGNLEAVVLRTVKSLSGWIFARSFFERWDLRAVGILGCDIFQGGPGELLTDADAARRL